MDRRRGPERQAPILKTADVVVVGGGVSGVAAAAAASRAGAQTLLIERLAYLGGTSTAGLMSGITNFYFTRRDERVVRGVAQEIVERLQKRGGVGLGPFKSDVPQIPNDPEVMKLVLIEILEDAGVEVLYHSLVSGVGVSEGRIARLFVETKGGRFAIEGRVFVDATGDADLVHLSGGEIEELRPNGSLEMRMANADVDRLLDHLVQNPMEYDEFGDVETNLGDCLRNWREKGLFHLPHGNGRRISIVQDAIARGDYVRELGLVHGLDAFGMYAMKETATVIVNTGFIDGPLLEPAFRSRAESDARKAAKVAADFLISRMPGFEKAYLVQTAPEIGVRLTRRIKGHYVLKEEELARFQRFDDVVAVATERKFDGPRFEEGFDIPYRIMLPKGIKGVLVASGKNVSTEPPGRLRGQVACMQIGQACGVAAALSVKANLVPQEIDIRSVQKQLLEQGVYLGDDERIRHLSEA